MQRLLEKENRACLALAAALGAAAVASLPLALCWEEERTHSAGMLALFALLVLAGARLLAARDRRLKRFSLAFGLAFSLAQVLGARLDAAGTVGGGLAPLWWSVAALSLTPTAGFGFAAFARLSQRLAARGAGAQTRRARGASAFYAPFAFILLCWLPVYLAYFPGMFNFDSAGQAAQFLFGGYNTVYPLAHTLFLGGCYRLGELLGSANTGIALYTAVQAVCLAASMAYAVSYLRKTGCPRAARVAATLCFALLPFHPLLAMSTTKDLFFSAAMLTLIVRLRMAWETPSLWKSARHGLGLAALMAAVCLLRTNGIAAVGALGLAGVILLWKSGLWKRFALIVLAGAALFGGTQAGLKLALHPSGTGIREGLSVPLMQVARVYALYEQQGEPLPEKEEILRFIPDADRYQPHLSDGVKRHATVGVVNLPQYLRLWASLGAREPAAFVDAFLYLNKGYWHLDDVTHLDIYAERGKHGYMETANHDGYGVSRASVLPGLQNALDRLYVENEYKRVPLLASIIEPAFWCWLTAATLGAALYRRRWDVCLGGALLAGLFASMMIGPCAYIRYAYPLALCAPLLVGLCLLPGEGERRGVKRTDCVFHADALQ